jgi:hypothetical protein
VLKYAAGIRPLARVNSGLEGGPPHRREIGTDLMEANESSVRGCGDKPPGRLTRRRPDLYRFSDLAGKPAMKTAREFANRTPLTVGTQGISVTCAVKVTR